MTKIRTKSVKGFKPISPYVYVGIRPNDLPRNIRIRLNYLKRTYSLDLISDAVCKVTKIQPEQLGQKHRHRHISEARKMYCYFAKQKMSLSLTEIGDSIGGRDHTTVIHNIEKFKDLYEVEPQFKRKADKVARIIEETSIDDN